VITSAIPPGLGAAIFLVQHSSPQFHFNVPSLLSRESEIPVRYARDQEPIAPDRIFVAPTDEHLIIERGRVRLQRSPKDPWNRPSINALFRSAAVAYGSSVAGVILSGMLSDGIAGLWEIKNAGGFAIVQDPTEAERPEMPTNALENVEVDFEESWPETSW
jgi:two-component system chemotaxis response regulator CheB